MFFSKHAFTATNVNIQLSKSSPIIGEAITITVTGDSNISYADLYYITQTDGQDTNKVCFWPGGWHTIQSNVGVGQPVSFTPPGVGNYYIVANIKDSNNNILCIGHFGWDASKSCLGYQKCQNAYASISVIPRPTTANVNIQLSKSSIELGDSINIKVTSDFAAHHVDLYLISQSDAQDQDKVCRWPGGWSVINTNINLGQDVSFVPPRSGSYYIVANLMDANNNPLCIGHFGWDASKSCSNVSKCTNAYAGFNVSEIDMNRYWNIKPGNYWIYQGMNYQLNQASRERWDVGAKTKATNADYRSGYPLIMSKSNASGYWGPAYSAQEATKLESNSTLKIWFNKETANCPIGRPCFTFPFWKAYEITDYNQYYKQGKMWWVYQYGDSNLPGEFLSPGSLYDLNSTYQTALLNGYQKRDWTNGFSEDNSYLYGSDYVGYHLKEENSILYSNVTSPSYSGKALTVKFSESGEYAGQWAMKEDYYLAKDIGPVKIAVKGFNNNYANNSSLCNDPGRTCTCTDVLASGVASGNDTDCNSINMLQRPMFDMVLAKYYLGGKLSVKLNNDKTSLTLKPGDSFSVDVSDPSTGYTYEGYLETDSNFISPGGQTVANGKFNKWFDESGKVNITINSSLPSGMYTASFRPWVSRLEPANSNAEAVVEQPNLPWSDKIVINVLSTNTTLPSVAITAPSITITAPSNGVIVSSTVITSASSANNVAIQSSSGSPASGTKSTLLSLLTALRPLVIRLLASSNNGRPLTIGSQGTDVWALQVFLQINGTGSSSAKLTSIGPTGTFGTVTQAALAEYQANVGITPSGYFGPKTRDYVNAEKK